MICRFRQARGRLLFSTRQPAFRRQIDYRQVRPVEANYVCLQSRILEKLLLPRELFGLRDGHVLIADCSEVFSNQLTGRGMRPRPEHFMDEEEFPCSYPVRSFR